MKKQLIVFALALVLVLLFSSIAGAKYAGYAGSGVRYDGAAANASVLSNAPGYLSWGAAVSQMQARGITGAALATPHGGYSIATAKCAVCHSAHRAIGKPGIANTVTGAGPDGMTLTPAASGGGACVECHTEWGSVGTGLPVEWAQSGSGPHGSNACATCHLGGIHGSGTSKFWGMNVFMLGGVNDAQITAETAAGPYGNYDPAYQDPTAVNNDSGWFWNGSSTPLEVGGTPVAMVSGVPIPMDAADWARNRQMLTGYTCSRAGCHTNSVLSTGYWGFSAMREQRQAGANSFFSPTTGHKAAPGTGTSEQLGDYCGPCHPGNPAGGYRVLSVWNPGAPIAGSGPVVNGVAQGQRTILNARQYGCDQCHDMVGVLTNSTAFPHANRNIAVYEWLNGNGNNGIRTIVSSQASGNLWMYAANSSGIGPWWPADLVDSSFTVINGAVGSGTNLGQWKDGACLKCHVPTDPASQALAGGGPLVSPQHEPAYGGWASFPGYNANGAGLADYLTYIFK